MKQSLWCSHILEYIKFDDVLELIKEAKRVLAPCGILILETPNPENIMVSTQWFYLDATHKNPIPCELLSFTTHYYGLERNFIFKTNEKSPSEYERDMGLFDVFEGVSPDYSVIAQKNGDQSELFDEAFAVMPGVNLAQISASYNNKFDKLKQQVNGVLNAYKRLYAPLPYEPPVCSGDLAEEQENHPVACDSAPLRQASYKTMSTHIRQWYNKRSPARR